MFCIDFAGNGRIMRPHDNIMFVFRQSCTSGAHSDYSCFHGSTSTIILAYVKKKKKLSANDRVDFHIDID